MATSWAWCDSVVARGATETSAESSSCSACRGPCCALTDAEMSCSSSRIGAESRPVAPSLRSTATAGEGSEVRRVRGRGTAQEGCGSRRGGHTAQRLLRVERGDEAHRLAVSPEVIDLGSAEE